MKKNAGTKNRAEPAAAVMAALLLLGAAALHLRALNPGPADPPGLARAAASGNGLARLALGRRLDLNRATAAELDQLPGIGPATARAIVSARDRAGRFASVDEAVAAGGAHSAGALRRWTEARP